MCQFDNEKQKAVKEEVARLYIAVFIKEVKLSKWLKKGKWRMCVDCMSLNKACRKDPFPLPHIDHVVDSTVGCKTFFFFLDANSRYPPDHD